MNRVVKYSFSAVAGIIVISSGVLLGLYGYDLLKQEKLNKEHAEIVEKQAEGHKKKIEVICNGFRVPEVAFGAVMIGSEEKLALLQKTCGINYSDLIGLVASMGDRKIIPAFQAQCEKTANAGFRALQDISR